MMLRSACALGVLATIGCGAAEDGVAVPATKTDTVAYFQPNQSDTAVSTAGGGSSDSLPPLNVPEGRKIIFEANLSVDVVDFGAAARNVDRLVVDHGGFITASQRGGRSGSSRSGTWTLRVPVGQYRALVETLTHLGELRDYREKSQEVTEEFYDLEARIQNKQQQEQRLLAHLDETARNLNEILTIEQEIGRVRGEIERMQGRLRLLADQTALSTIHLSLQEIETFVPAETPTFATRLDRAWRGSIEALSGVLQMLAITLTAAAPWAGMLLVVGLLPAVWLRRRLARHGLQ